MQSHWTTERRIFRELLPSLHVGLEVIFALATKNPLVSLGTGAEISHGYRVPHDRYIVYFGREHRFRVHSFPVVVVSGRPRFHYHDCWITLVDPWAEYWSANWYENDDVYVEYVNDGYYMYNTRDPGVAIAINISL